MGNPKFAIFLKIFVPTLFFTIPINKVIGQYLPDTYSHLPATHNFVRSYTVLQPGLTAQQITDASADPRVVQLSTAYFDGLGRPLQTVNRQGSLNTSVAGSTPKDLVQLHTYDEFGREVYQYLPYAHSTSSDGNFKGTAINDPTGIHKVNPNYSPFAQQRDFYHTNNNLSPVATQGETYFYSQTNFELSPLNRAEKSLAPGNNWVGSNRGVKMEHHFNTVTDGVRIWTATYPALGSWGSYSTPGAYPAGQLYKTITTDEHGRQVIEFKDKQGQVILKKVQLTANIDDGSGAGYDGWICTYYIYDDFGSLRCVVQPEGVKWLAVPANNWNLGNATILSELCFRYEYDERRRMIMKKVPGADPVYMVYDKRDRIVLTQDGNMRLTPARWMYTWYDELNRPITTGIWTTTTNFTTLRINAANYPAVPYQHYPLTGSSGLEVLTHIYYDNYLFTSDPVYAGNGFVKNPGPSIFSYFFNHGNDDDTNFPYPRKMQCAQNVLGMVTGSKTKILNTNNWIYSLIHYDNEGRQLVAQQYNQESNVIDFNVTRYGFAGQPYYTLHRQDIGLGTGQTQFVVTRTETKFDAIGRPAEKLNGIAQSSVNSGGFSTPKAFVKMQYDALGQIKKKNIGQKPGAAAGTPLESLNYEYNIRGWLLGVNRPFVGTANTGLPEAGKWFGFDLGFDKPTNATDKIYDNVQYNGNISGQSWRSAGDNVARQYQYSYDAANRLLKGDFMQHQGTWAKTFKYDVLMGAAGNDDGTAYDLNGNIKRMQQFGWTIASPIAQIDNITYTYLNSSTATQTYSNKLRGVGDNITSPEGLGDFKNKNTAANDYGYDKNGNMVTDLNKRLNGSTGGSLSTGGNIVYNHLNLPRVINVKKDDGTPKGTITYTYDAAGNKVEKKVEETGVTIGTTTNITIITKTHYLGGFVYESKSYAPMPTGYSNYNYQLQFFGHEEGRVRVLRPTPQSNPVSLAYDYMLKDHLGNVRMVLTEEVKQTV